MKYPARLKPTDGGFVVTFKDIPEANTQGETFDEAVEMAEDALLTALTFYFEDNRTIPLPSEPKRSETLIDLPISASIKVVLLNTLLETRVSQSKLAKRMGISPQQVTRIVNLNHTTKVDTLAAAFKALGRELKIIVS